MNTEEPLVSIVLPTYKRADLLPHAIRSVLGQTYTNLELIVGALNDAHGTSFDTTFLRTLGREVLEMEWEFNRAAGFTEADDELPSFFYDEPLQPSGKSARHHSDVANQSVRELLTQ